MSNNSASHPAPLAHRKRRKSPSPATPWLPTKEHAEAFLVASGKRAAPAQDDDNHADSDAESSVVSTSSEEPSSDSESAGSEGESEGEEEEDSNEVTSLPRPPKPSVRRKLYKKTNAASERVPLSERLKAFLPQLAAANEELEREKAAGRLGERSLEVENGKENEGQYIEMDLGLGVLEEKDPNAADSSSESSNESGDEMDVDGEAGGEKKTKEKDVLGKLMGKKRTQPGAGIQEVPEQ
ncbi:uncharacterized protein K452DRAFT_290418 [Aplosporella prunicola CBS 121167]|uniref:Uncharacterized protein n=1 Tax=Aplosporella prunicola CBS 121167 TaxID=1176127 RepID=A0A6A6B570_9PEZI|nr:uncharacterized protein K452DRAFT_290418 [Aplosporella prunicola CBS 121167]KAF2138768.1 hypothetical protein K452DRAFT_290418 [Aplosporella prunicola CBS 121167]